jgi:hypothetical protein
MTAMYPPGAADAVSILTPRRRERKTLLLRQLEGAERAVGAEARYSSNVVIYR